MTTMQRQLLRRVLVSGGTLLVAARLDKCIAKHLAREGWVTIQRHGRGGAASYELTATPDGARDYGLVTGTEVQAT